MILIGRGPLHHRRLPLPGVRDRGSTPEGGRHSTTSLDPQ